MTIMAERLSKVALTRSSLSMEASGLGNNRTCSVLVELTRLSLFQWPMAWWVPTCTTTPGWCHSSSWIPPCPNQRKQTLKLWLQWKTFGRYLQITLKVCLHHWKLFIWLPKFITWTSVHTHEFLWDSVSYSELVDVTIPSLKEESNNTYWEPCLGLAPG